MEKRIINIRVTFVCFCGLMVGILFCLFNTFQNFHILKTILFFSLILIISVALFLYGIFTRKRNSLYYARRKVSFLVMASGVAFLISTICGFLITIYPYATIVNLNGYDNDVRIEGVVSDYVSDNSTYLKFILKDCYIENAGEVIECDFKICVYADVYIDVSLGDILLIEDCALNKYSHAKSSDLLKLSQGVGYQTYVNYSDVKVTEGKMSLKDKIKSNARDVLTENLNEDNSNIIYAMLFGEKEGLNENIKDSFSYAGISHILAVSGLHVGILATAILFVLNKIKMNKYLRISILSIILFLYAYLCSFSPSVCRAGIMTFLLALCGILQIEYDGLSSLSIAGVIILLFSPTQILSLSFQLSFLSVFAIISFAFTINRLLNRIKVPNFLSSAIAISVATNLGILPVCANAFTKVSLLGIFTNLFVLPLFTVTYIFAFFIILFALLFNFGGGLLFIPNLFLHLIKFIANLSTNTDFLVLKTFQNGYLVLFFVCAAILLLHFLMVKKYIKCSIIIPLIIISIIQMSFYNIEYSARKNTLIFSHQYNSNVVFYVKDDIVTMIGSNIDCDNLLYTLKELKIRNIDNIIAYDLQLNEINNLKEICVECKTKDVFIPNRYAYDEISQEFPSVSYYDKNLNLQDLQFRDIYYGNQTIGIYLNISDIGDILIPELKPTKKEGLFLSEEYNGVKYFYQPSISKNINLDVLKPKNIILNSTNESGISLGKLGTVYIDKEYSYEV